MPKTFTVLGHFWFHDSLDPDSHHRCFVDKWHKEDNVIKEESKRGHIGEEYPKSEGCWLRHKIM